MEYITGKKHNVNFDTVLKYSIERKRQHATLEFDSLRIKISQDGKKVINKHMGKGMLKNGFGEPVCQLTFDGKGKELERTVVAGPLAKPLVDEGLIADALFFHTEFPSDQDKWKSSKEFSLGNGRGILKYEKEQGAGEGEKRSVVRVSGVLTNASCKHQALVLKNIKYEVSGIQIFDTAIMEWESGDILFNHKRSIYR